MIDKPSLPIGLYKHYTGKLYQVTELARHQDNKEWLVIYRNLQDQMSCWVRSLEVFLEEVEYEGQRQPRFHFIGDIDLGNAKETTL